MWAGYLPTVTLEEWLSRQFSNILPLSVKSGLGTSGTELFSSVCAGAAAGVWIAAPIEYQITQSHMRNQRIDYTIIETAKKKGIFKCVAPYGQAAMAGREIPFTVGLFFLRERIGRTVDSIFPPLHGLSTWKKSCVWWSGQFSGSMITAMTIQIFAHPPSVLLALQQGRDLTLRQASSKIWLTFGWRGFYAGFVARTVSITGAALVFPIVMDATATCES